MILYRYLPPQRLDSLLSGELFFTPPIRFNDPFDLRPVIVPITSRSYLRSAARAAEKELNLPKLAFKTKAAKRAFLRGTRKKVVSEWRKNASAIAVNTQSAFPNAGDVLAREGRFRRGHSGFGCCNKN